MSLDVYLTTPGVTHRNASESGIFLRENGQTREISRTEWEQRFPGREPATLVPDEEESETVYSANITHNLGKMAGEAGIYLPLWRPDEIGVTKASQLIAPLREGLGLLCREPERFKALNPENGWGNYEGLVHFVANYLVACEEYPDAEVGVSR
jgi:hypothetical protein